MNRIESQVLSVAELFDGASYVVPPFQREFRWQARELERFLSDIHEALCAPQGTAEYFIGSIVGARAEGGTIRLIDGHHRVTSLYVLLCGIRDHLRACGEPLNEALERQIGGGAPRLALLYEEASGIAQRLAAGVSDADALPSGTPSIRNITGCYRLVRAFLAAELKDDPIGMRKFLLNLTSRVHLLRLCASDEETAIRAFETLGRKGSGPGATEVLRDRLFRHVPPGEFGRIKERWKHFVRTLDECDERPLRFLKHYAMASHTVEAGRRPAEPRIVAWLEEHAGEIGLARDPQGFASDLVSAARACARFARGFNLDGSPNRYLMNIRFLSGPSTQHLSLLLAARHLKTPLFTELCHWVENVIFCHSVAGVPSDAFEPRLPAWSEELRALRPDDAAGLESFVSRRILPELAQCSRDFDYAFDEMSEDRLPAQRLRYILAKFAQHVEEATWGMPAHADLGCYFSRATQIEHLLPSDPAPEALEAFDKRGEYDTFRKRLGNLTLIERELAGGGAGRPFSAKMPLYARSSILLTKSLVERLQPARGARGNSAVATHPVEGLLQFDRWDSMAIELRQSTLARLARRIWRMDEAQAAAQAA